MSASDPQHPAGDRVAFRDRLRSRGLLPEQSLDRDWGLGATAATPAVVPPPGPESVAPEEVEPPPRHDREAEETGTGTSAEVDVDDAADAGAGS